jgi:branched-chain amino acid aminotransferase
MKTIDLSNYLEVLSALRKPWQQSYYALYSSVLGGVVVDPLLMQVPIDDHLVHRGDGVFDTFKCVGRAAYNLEAHLGRLVRSAGSIGLTWPGGLDEIRALTVQTLAAAGREACFGRMVLARGPGGFGVSPYESPEPALYIVVYAAAEPFMRTHPEGASVRRSTVPVKAYATVKHCNYLPNVLMKREAVDWGVDFTVGFSDSGFMAEGATENAGIVTRAGELLFPRLDAVLTGTTMLRVMQFAESLVASGALAKVAFRDIAEADVRGAAELLIVGTPVNVVSARTYEGQPVGDGKPGPVARALNRLLERDIAENEALRTRY